MKYLYLYIRKKRVDGYELVYPLKALPQKKHGRVVWVKKGTFQYYHYLLTSRVIITNGGGVSYIPKRRGQMIINTWHGGGPYKRTSTSVFDGFFYRQEVLMNARQIDYMLSSCEYCTRLEFSRMMIGRDKCINSGIPRNDVFFSDRPDIRQKVRLRYGIGNHVKIVLYAPTFRLDLNDYTKEKMAQKINIDQKGVVDALAERFGGEWRFVVRFHPKVSNLADVEKGIINATDYPDMQELLYTADAVITDYSSLMWDFALTGKPVFLHAQDIDEYSIKPGFYMPVEKWPYPLAKTNDGLLRNIRNFDQHKYTIDLEKHFRESGCYETGTACRTVLELIEGNYMALNINEEQNE